MSVPTCELVGLKKEADLAASAVKWFSGLTVADATDSPAPPGARKFSQAWILSKYTYRLPLRCRKERKNKLTITAGRRETSKGSLHAYEKERIGFVIIALTITSPEHSWQEGVKSDYAFILKLWLLRSHGPYSGRWWGLMHKQHKNVIPGVALNNVMQLL